MPRFVVLWRSLRDVPFAVGDASCVAPLKGVAVDLAVAFRQALQMKRDDAARIEYMAGSSTMSWNMQSLVRLLTFSRHRRFETPTC